MALTQPPKLEVNSGQARSRLQESSVGKQEFLFLVSVPKTQKATCVSLRRENMKKQSKRCNEFDLNNIGSEIAVR